MSVKIFLREGRVGLEFSRFSLLKMRKSHSIEPAHIFSVTGKFTTLKVNPKHLPSRPYTLHCFYSCTMRLHLSIWAEDLPGTSIVGTPDPFAVVTVLNDDPGRRPTLVGKTETIQNTFSPDWTKIMTLEDFELGASTKIVVSIYDDNKRNDVPMGSTLFDVGSVLGAKGSILAKEIKGGGVVAVHVEPATESAILHFQLQGKDLINTEGLGLMRKSDPFFELQRLRKSLRSGGKVWDTVFRSHPVDNDLNPLWNESYIDLQTLCSEKRKQKLRIAVYDFEKNGKHVPMGEVKVSVEELVAAISKNAHGSADTALTLKKEGNTTGQLVVLAANITEEEGRSSKVVVEELEEEINAEATAEMEEEITVAAENEEVVAEPDDLNMISPTFVNYIAGGCKLHVVTAIDCTATNGDPREPNSLHFFKDKGQNDYEDALNDICTILSKYDSDQQYPLLGFGAKRNNAVSHCFLFGNEANGVDGILKTYRDTFRAGIVMSSPRNFSELIHAARKEAKAQLVRS